MNFGLINRKKMEKIVAYVLALSKLEKKDASFYIYEQTNENLDCFFNFFNVRGKDVLTVLASSDQLFSCYYNGAKSIDTFDKSMVTLYYYYLRKWLITYKNKLYPSYHFFYDGDKDLYNLVCSIEPSNIDEAEAKFFCFFYMELHDYKTDKYLFHFASYSQPKPYEYSLSSIKGIFKERLPFSCRNIFHQFDMGKKYQVLLLSNMLEYAETDWQLENARKNIESLLVDDGMAICTSMIYSSDSEHHLNEVKALTSGLLEKDSSCYKYYESLVGRERDLAYVYRKKR